LEAVGELALFSLFFLVAVEGAPDLHVVLAFKGVHLCADELGP
jgi:hypothetical protein